MLPQIIVDYMALNPTTYSDFSRLFVAYGIPNLNIVLNQAHQTGVIVSNTERFNDMLNFTFTACEC
jgi:hypothetical protein